MKNMDVIKMAKRTEISSDLYADFLAIIGFPFPKWYDTRISAASPNPSVVASKVSQIDPRIAHVATSAGPKCAAKKVSTSHCIDQVVFRINAKVHNLITKIH